MLRAQGVGADHRSKLRAGWPERIAEVGVELGTCPNFLQTRHFQGLLQFGSSRVDEEHGGLVASIQACREVRERTEISFGVHPLVVGSEDVVAS